MSIELHSAAATAEEREKGLAAALAVFAASKIKPEGAALGRHEVTLFEQRGRRGPEPRPEAYQAAEIFDRAQAAAFRASGEHLDGYLRVDIDEESYFGKYMAQSAVLQWQDPEEAGRPAN